MIRIPRKILFMAMLVTVVVVVCVASYALITKDEKYEVTIEDVKDDETTASIIDYSKYPGVLNERQQATVESGLRLYSNRLLPDDQTLTASIRDSSVSRSNEDTGETTFIVDSPSLQTSYLVSRYVSSANSIDILNIICVPLDKQVYEKDYCRAE